MLNLKQRYGQWALVTGGTSGIGAAIVQQLAAGGLKSMQRHRQLVQMSVMGLAGLRCLIHNHTHGRSQDE